MTPVGGWASAVPHDTPRGPLLPFDATKPNIARVYDCFLGGKDNFASDRELAEKILAIYPGARQMAVVILSFRVRQGCDLRRPVADSVADGTLAA